MIRGKIGFGVAVCGVTALGIVLFTSVKSRENPQSAKKVGQLVHEEFDSKNPVASNENQTDKEPTGVKAKTVTQETEPSTKLVNLATKLIDLQMGISGTGSTNPSDVPNSQHTSETGIEIVDEKFSQADVVKIFPEIGIAASESNEKFIQKTTEARKTRPALFRRTDWPMQIALEMQQSKFAAACMSKNKIRNTEKFLDSSDDAIRAAAAKGNPEAQGILGAAYFQKETTRAEGIKLLEESFNGGNARSATVLGVAYLLGFNGKDGITKDYIKGLTLVRIGLEMGDTAAIDIINNKKINFEKIPTGRNSETLMTIASKYKLDANIDTDSNWDKKEWRNTFSNFQIFVGALDDPTFPWREWHNIRGFASMHELWNSSDSSRSKPELKFEILDGATTRDESVIFWKIEQSFKVVRWGFLSLRDIPFLLYCRKKDQEWSEIARSNKLSDGIFKQIGVSDTGYFSASYTTGSGLALKVNDKDLDFSWYEGYDDERTLRKGNLSFDFHYQANRLMRWGFDAREKTERMRQKEEEMQLMEKKKRSDQSRVDQLLK